MTGLIIRPTQQYGSTLTSLERLQSTLTLLVDLNTQEAQFIGLNASPFVHLVNAFIQSHSQMRQFITEK